MSCPAATASVASLDAGLTAQGKMAFIDVIQQATADQLDASAKLLLAAPAPGPYPLSAALATAQAACLRNPALANVSSGWWASQSSTAKGEIVGGVVVVVGLIAYAIHKKKKK